MNSVFMSDGLGSRTGWMLDGLDGMFQVKLCRYKQSDWRKDKKELFPDSVVVMPISAMYCSNVDDGWRKVVGI